MKKAFDQTVRELKREVNKKVLKVPGIEQKILDATSNELWGPHGSLLADIAHATRNYQEYQIIMHVLWKRLNDSGKNWRHVYKSLTVLEYLVGYGSERVIDEIKEHAYQISTLSDFQYIDSSGKDQGNNVRRKSQSLVSLVNDKEKIQEVREKALANKDKFRATFSSSGSNKPASYSSTSGYGDRYDDDRYEGRYGSRDDDRNGYGKERDLGYRDDDRYARGGDFYRDGDGFGRESDEHSGRGSYKNDDNKGRGNDDSQFGPRNKSFDKDRDHSYEEDDSYSNRNGGSRANDSSPDERNLERKLSEQSVGAPPNYDAAVRNDGNHVQDERDLGVGTATVFKALSPAVPNASSPQSAHHGEHQHVRGIHSSPLSMDDVSFDEFDPRGFTAAVNSTPLASSGSSVDLFGNSSPMDSVNSLALVPTSQTTTADETEMATSTNSGFGINFVALSSASASLSQPTEDPFGEGPFKAMMVPQDNFSNQEQKSVLAASADSSFPLSGTSTSPVGPMMDGSLNFDFGDSLSGLTYMPSVANDALYSTNSTVAALGPQHVYGHAPNIHTSDNVFYQQQFGLSIPSLPTQPVPPRNLTQQSTQRASSTISGPSSGKQSNDTFETKSSVWADTLNRGLVNLNISGAKTNPLADIGVDFDSINRLERRREKEKSSANPLTSTVTMGKAMGSGSGIGRSGPGPGPTIRPSMGMGMSMGGSGAGMGIGTYSGGVMGGGMGMNMGMGMGMGMGQGGSMRGAGPGPGPHPEMQSPSPAFPGSGYNNMTGMGGYGGGYR